MNQPFDFTSYRALFQEGIYTHLKECFFALDKEDYFASAIWGAVFLEGLVVVMIEQLLIPKHGHDDFNGHIQMLNNYAKNGNKEAGPEMPTEVVRRCDEIRNIRNRLVHHTGASKATLKHDASLIAASLQVILEWFRKHAPLASTDISPTQEDEQGVPVFISTVTPHEPGQTHFLQTFMQELRSVGIRPVQFKDSMYDRTDPIGKLKKVMLECEAVIVIGLEKSHAFFIRDKPGSTLQTDYMHRKYSSGWLHLEAGMANALEKEIFVFCQHDVASDGIFDRYWNTYPVLEFRESDVYTPEFHQFFMHISEWGKKRSGQNRSSAGL